MLDSLHSTVFRSSFQDFRLALSQLIKATDCIWYLLRSLLVISRSGPNDDGIGGRNAPRSNDQGQKRKVSMGSLTIKLEFSMAVWKCARRKRGSWTRLRSTIGNQQPHPIYLLPSVAPHLSEGDQYLQYTRSINSRPCPPSHFIKKLVWTTLLRLVLAHSLCLHLNRLRLHCSRPSSIS